MVANVVSNLVSLDIPAEKMARIVAALQVLDEDLMPHLVALLAKNRRDRPKMGDSKDGFVRATLAYMQANPQLKPGFVDLEEFARDVAAVDTLDRLKRRLTPVLGMLDDTRLLCGSEALAAALACYQAIKVAAKLGTPAAVTIFNKLSVYFPARHTKSTARAAGTDGPVAGSAAAAPDAPPPEE